MGSDPLGAQVGIESIERGCGFAEPLNVKMMKQQKTPANDRRGFVFIQLSSRG
ncbi:MAG: hypothetical protein WD768_02835 [Phycisphaeraceae bacterium]